MSNDGVGRRAFLRGAGIAGSLYGAALAAEPASGTRGKTAEATGVTEGTGALQTDAIGGSPMYQYDPANTGHGEAETGPSGELAERWRFETGDAVSTSPAVVDGVVYAGSADGRVYALDAATGEEQWRFEAADEIRSSPAVVDGVVYVGSNDGSVYALNATDGFEQWSAGANNAVTSSPAVVDGVVYVGSNDGSVYALDAADGSRRWRFRTGSQVSSSPAVVDGVVYVGSNDNSVYALDAADGTEQWRFRTGARVTSSPAVAYGIVYVGSADASVYAIRTTDGGEQWRFRTENVVGGSPAVANDTVYVGSVDRTVYAVNAFDGTGRWEFGTDGRVSTSPAVADGVVHVRDDDGVLYGLAADDGELAWRFGADEGGPSSPVVVDGLVYVGEADGRVRAIAEAPGVEIVGRTLSSGTVRVGSDAVVRVELTNEGGSEGEITLSLTVNGSVATERTVTVPASSSRTVELRYRFDSPGSYNVGVNGTAVDTITVTETTPTPTSGSTATATPTEATATRTPAGGGDPGNDDTGGGAPAGGGGGGNPLRGIPMELLLLVVGGLVGIGTVRRVLRRRSSGGEESGGPVERSNDDIDRVEDRLEAAGDAHTVGDVEAAIDAYEEALGIYDRMPDGAATEERLGVVEPKVAAARETLQELRSQSEDLRFVTQTLSLAERNHHGAITAHARDQRTSARVAYRQARDRYDRVLERLDEAGESVLTENDVRVTFDPEGEPPPEDLAAIPGVTGEQATALAEAGFETLSDLQAADEASLEELEQLDALDEDLVAKLVALSGWRGTDRLPFRTREDVERRRAAAFEGYRAV